MISDTLKTFSSDPMLRPAASARQPAQPASSIQQWGVVSADPVPVFADVFRGLMQLHQELMVEKDQALELTRSLMERRQEVAELQSLVRLLEQRLEEANSRRKPDVEGWR
jgi:hypothetical protein